MQEHQNQHERMQQVRVQIKSAASRSLIHLADIEHVQDQMREINARLGKCVRKVGEEEFGEDGKQ